MPPERPIPFAVSIPVKTVSEANIRCHWAERAKRVRQQRAMVHWCLKQDDNFAAWCRWVAAGNRCAVVLSRHAPRELDVDNLFSSLKAIRDQVADDLGLPNDRDLRVEWRVQQVKMPSRKAMTVVVAFLHQP